MVLIVMPYDSIYIYSDKHTSTREEIKISPPNLSEGDLLHSSMISQNLERAHVIAKENLSFLKLGP